MKIVKVNARWRLLLSVGLIGGVIALAFLPTAHSVSYVRYVSPPFPDGTRYTFLRPDYLDEIDFNNRHVVRVDRVGIVIQGLQADRGVSALECNAPFQLEFLFPSKDEKIVTLVHKPTFTFSTSTQAKTNKTIKDQNELGAWVVHHATVINDMRSQMRFDLWHSANNGSASFRRDDETIASSFRVLPPGAAAPNQ